MLNTSFQSLLSYNISCTCYIHQIIRKNIKFYILAFAGVRVCLCNNIIYSKQGKFIAFSILTVGVCRGRIYHFSPMYLHVRDMRASVDIPPKKNGLIYMIDFHTLSSSDSLFLFFLPHRDLTFDSEKIFFLNRIN